MANNTLSESHPTDQHQQQPSSSSVIEINHGEGLSPSNSVQILLVRPSTMESIIGSSNPNQPDHQTLLIHYPRTKVQDLKSHISSNWTGKPKIDGIRLIARGRILNDPESIGEALGKVPGDQTAHPIHVVIRPNAWTEKLPTAPTRSVSAPPTATVALPALSSAPVASSSTPTPPSLLASTPIQPNPPHPQGNENDPPNFLSGSAPSDPDTHASNSFPAHSFIGHFSCLTSYGKLNFIQNMLQAQFKIVERVDLLRRQIHNHHLQLVGINTLGHKKSVPSQDQLARDEQDWKLLDRKLTKLLFDLNIGPPPPEPSPSSLVESDDSSIEPGSCPLSDESGAFQQIEIAGLPYLLYLPVGLSSLSGSRAPNPHLKVYRSLQKELDRALYLDSQVHLIILHIQKLHAGRHQIDEILAAFDPTTTAGQFNYAQRIQNIVHGLAYPPFPAPPLAGVPGLAPAPANGVPGAGLGFGFGMGPEALVHPNNILFPNVPMWQHPMARVRRYEFTINLESMRRYMAPLLWLSLKLSVLLYIFGRHASFSKLVILTLIALGWVLWEAFSISQRHEAQARRRDRLQRGQQAPGGGVGQAVDPIQAVLDRGRRRAERERVAREQRPRADNPPETEHIPEAQPVPNNPPPAAPAPLPAAQAPVAVVAPNRRNPAARGLRAAAADIRARGGAFPPGTEVRPFRTTSAFSPKYWFNSIAVVGLASEYRELGLHSIGERALGASNLEYPRWYRYLRNLKTGIILFFGTLLPEIEKKRRKALEKRARILNLVIADAARDVNTQQNRNQAQEAPALAVNNDRAVGNGHDGTDGPANRLGSSTAVPVSDEQTTSPTDRTFTHVDGADQSTPRPFRASALEGTPPEASIHSALLRRSRLSAIESKQVQLDDGRVAGSPPSGNSTGSSGCPKDPLPEKITRLNLGNQQSQLFKADALDQNIKIGPSSTMNKINETDSKIPSGIAADPIPGSSTSTIVPGSSIQQQPQLHPVEPALQSPLTPLDAPQVVGGLDDTDDEEIIGGENDEAGMLLF